MRGAYGGPGMKKDMGGPGMKEDKGGPGMVNAAVKGLGAMTPTGMGAAKMAEMAAKAKAKK